MNIPFPLRAGDAAFLSPGDGGQGETRIYAEIAAERARQVEAFGHTADADDARPLIDLARAAHGGRALAGAIEYVHFNKPDLARRYLLKAAALIVATIESLDRRYPPSPPTGD